MGCTVDAISWNRVNLSMTVSLVTGPGDGCVEFSLTSGAQRFPVHTSALGDGRYRLDVNLTNVGSRRALPDGAYRVTASVGGVDGPAATWDLARLPELDDASRSFLFGGDQSCYVASFAISEDEEPVLLLRVFQMSRTASPAPAAATPVLRRLRERALPGPRRVGLANAWYSWSRRVNPPNGTRILFASEMRTKLEGNLLRLHDRMVERGLDQQFELRYSFRLPSMVTPASTLRLLYLIASSDIVLIDDYFGALEVLRLAPETKIIQVWHAGSGFKNIGFSRFGNWGSPKLQNAHRKYTFAITGSQHLVPVYAEAFGIEESAVIPTGLPRIDVFLDEQRTEGIVADFRRRYPHLRDKRLMLFAPTFRGRGVQDAYYDYSRLDFDKLYDVCGADTVILFRMHHFITAPVPIPPEYADRLIDFGEYPDTNDLLHLVDVLITDYSSIVYEFSLLDRPMIFFAYDKDAYAATRGFHRSFEETAPGRICETIDDLVEAIKNGDYETEKIEKFRRENFDEIDTHSADRVIDRLILGDPRTEPVTASTATAEDDRTE